MQTHARKAGLDPLAVEWINLGDWCARPYPKYVATERATVLLTAAVARARAFPGSGPENVKPYLVGGHQKIGRRALFTLPPIGYRPIVSIDAQLCVTGTGCQLCSDVCPRDALAKADGRLSVDRDRCIGCGLCVSECPRAATHLPTHSLPQLEAELTELLTNPRLEASQPKAILFTCQRSSSALRELRQEGGPLAEGWLPVHVPCAGMVSATWLLQCFALGASTVGVMICDDDCPHRQRDRLEGKIEYCSEILRLVTGKPGDLRLLTPSARRAPGRAPAQPVEPSLRPFKSGSHNASLSGPLAAAQALSVLSQDRTASPTFELAHAYSPLGVVHIEPDRCTACGACASACPTDALALRRTDDALSLTFDAVLCTGCGLCDVWCPEKAIHVDKATDLPRLSRGRTPLYKDKEARCEVCGAVIAPQAMLRRVEALLSTGASPSVGLMSNLSRRCPSCRGMGLPLRGASAKPASRDGSGP
jgi:ferredoxin